MERRLRRWNESGHCTPSERRDDGVMLDMRIIKAGFDLVNRRPEQRRSMNSNGKAYNAHFASQYSELR